MVGGDLIYTANGWSKAASGHIFTLVPHAHNATEMARKNLDAVRFLYFDQHSQNVNLSILDVIILKEYVERMNFYVLDFEIWNFESIFNVIFNFF